jgi:UDP-N-acetylmuramoylalanine--D-glutamate ligase
MTKRFVILGGGESGVGAAILAKKLGYDVFLSDRGKIADKYLSVLHEYAIEFEEGQHTEANILNADEVMKSPGIAEKYEIVKKIRAANLPVISEIEFAARHTKAQIVGITGSNGKTTTTSLVYHILQRGGLDVGLAGNIGISFARQVAEHDRQIFVLEISSFQLDDIVSFQPHIAVLTNLSPDHLDRYNYDYSQYIQSKFNITKNQTAQNIFIYCADDKDTLDYMTLHQTDIKAQLYPFSFINEQAQGAYVRNNQEIIINTNHNQFIMSINELGLNGKHNIYNSMAAGIVGRLYDLRKEEMRESLQDFQALEHRMETVGKIGGIEFINDSKATNVNSTWFALESMSKPIVWIAGGIDKGNDYEVLIPLVKKHVKALICLGVDSSPLHKAFSKHVDMIINTTDMIEAVNVAARLADSGDVVLLSPACASFDLFENYEDRGKKFKSAVRNL